MNLKEKLQEEYDMALKNISQLKCQIQEQGFMIDGDGKLKENEKVFYFYGYQDSYSHKSGGTVYGNETCVKRIIGKATDFSLLDYMILAKFHISDWVEYGVDADDSDYEIYLVELEECIDNLGIFEEYNLSKKHYLSVATVENFKSSIEDLYYNYNWLDYSDDNRGRNLEIRFDTIEDYEKIAEFDNESYSY